MTLKSILEDIENILAATPFSFEDLAKFRKEEENKKYFEPSNLLALGVALDYYKTHSLDKVFNYTKFQKKFKKLRKQYETRLTTESKGIPKENGESPLINPIL